MATKPFYGCMLIVGASDDVKQHYCRAAASKLDGVVAEQCAHHMTVMTACKHMYILGASQAAHMLAALLGACNWTCLATRPSGRDDGGHDGGQHAMTVEQGQPTCA